MRIRRLALICSLLALLALSACGGDDEGQDAGPDTGLDAAVDAGPDGGGDGGIDAGRPDSGYDLHVASPEWQDQIIYFVMLDRFQDGDQSNNDQGEGEYDPSTNSRYSGGDLTGVIQRLDYIRGLGATAVWITPPVANQWWDEAVQFGGYHGYWARNFKAVDEHYGTLEEYQRLSHELHQRGMYLVQDIVTNHTGNFFYYDGAYSSADPTQNFTLNTASVPTTAPEMSPFDQNDINDPDHRAAGIYHWTPSIDNFNDPVQELTYQLSNLDDLATENPVVRKALRDAYGYWIREVGVDAFRIDTVKFVEHEFWNDFIHSTDAETPGINAVAAETGRDDFLTFGEVFEVSEPFDDAGDRKAASYLGTAQSPELMSVLGFPVYEEIGRVFGGGRATELMSYRLGRFMDRTLFPNPFIIPNFIDNHDVQRFLQGGSKEAFQQALTFLMTIPGIPVIYYGTEQGFSETRASMFEGGYMSGGVDHFDDTGDDYLFLQSLIGTRKSNPILSRGELAVLQDSAAGAGILAFERTLGADKAIVLFNTADEHVLVSGLDTGLAPGMSPELLSGAGLTEAPVVRSDGSFLVVLPPRASVVVKSSADVGQAPVATASIAVSTSLEGETLSQDLWLEGTVSPPDTELWLVIDDYIDRAVQLDVNLDGTWGSTLAVSQFPFGVSKHHLTVYAPTATVASASERYTFTTDVVFDGEIIEVEDPLGDDNGPTGAYFYPMDATFSRPGDIQRVVVEAGGSSMNLKITMRELTTVWNPANGFDHVSFTTYFDAPGQDGLTLLPKINGTAPTDFAWDFTHFCFGFGNSLHSTTNASETEWGQPIAGRPQISVDAPSRTITFTYDKDTFGLDTWEGVKIYITTWDFDGIDAIYRPLSPAGSQWGFGGGDATDPFIMDDVGPIVIPVTN